MNSLWLLQTRRSGYLEEPRNHIQTWLEKNKSVFLNPPLLHEYLLGHVGNDHRQSLWCYAEWARVAFTFSCWLFLLHFRSVINLILTNIILLRFGIWPKSKYYIKKCGDYLNLLPNRKVKLKNILHQSWNIVNPLHVAFVAEETRTRMYADQSFNKYSY